MSALKGIIDKLSTLGYTLDDTMALSVQDAIDILDKGINKRAFELEQLANDHIEWLGDITRDIQIFVDAPDGTEVVDMDCKE